MTKLGWEAAVDMGNPSVARSGPPGGKQPHAPWLDRGARAREPRAGPRRLFGRAPLGSCTVSTSASTPACPRREPPPPRPARPASSRSSRPIRSSRRSRRRRGTSSGSPRCSWAPRSSRRCGWPVALRGEIRYALSPAAPLSEVGDLVQSTPDRGWPTATCVRRACSRARAPSGTSARWRGTRSASRRLPATPTCGSRSRPRGDGGAEVRAADVLRRPARALPARGAAARRSREERRGGRWRRRACAGVAARRGRVAARVALGHRARCAPVLLRVLERRRAVSTAAPRDVS